MTKISIFAANKMLNLYLESANKSFKCIERPPKKAIVIQISDFSAYTGKKFQYTLLVSETLKDIKVSVTKKSNPGSLDVRSFSLQNCSFKKMDPFTKL